MSPYIVSSFYQFRAFGEARLSSLRADLLETGSELDLCGQIIIAGEGLNGTICGSPANTAIFKNRLVPILDRYGSRVPDESEILFKDSSSEQAPFRQWTVKIRRETVTSSLGPLQPAECSGNYLSPREWRDKIQNDPAAVVLDTRNRYETEIGAFENAIVPDIDSFTDFERYLIRSDLPRDRPMLIYCTGGIRCEKAGPLMKRLGFEQIYQLRGGILSFLEQYPDDLFRGECFVFDDRVALDQTLRPSKKFQFCPHCGAPACNSIVCSRCSEPARICNDCLKNENRPVLHRSCSKNCANLLSAAVEPLAPA